MFCTFIANVYDRFNFGNQFIYSIGNIYGFTSFFHTIKLNGVSYSRVSKYDTICSDKIALHSNLRSLCVCVAFQYRIHNPTINLIPYKLHSSKYNMRNVTVCNCICVCACACVHHLFIYRFNVELKNDTRCCCFHLLVECSYCDETVN